jgi:hypothetical protein
MEIIRHRRNTSSELAETPHEYGIEFDLRSEGSRLILHHDPFVGGEEFSAWLEEYRHGTLIVNVKEEGLEQAALDILRAHNVERFFFLDQSFPFLIKTARTGERRCAVRVSEYESIQTALALSGRIDWIWVDCFTRFPLARSDADQLREAGFKLCLVSPELQGRSAEQEIPEMRSLLKELGIAIEAVCTKAPDLWR